MIMTPEAAPGVAGSGIMQLDYVFDSTRTQAQIQQDIKDTIEGLSNSLIDNYNQETQFIHSIDVNSAGMIVHIVDASLASSSDTIQTLEGWAAYSVTQLNAIYVQPAVEAVEGTGEGILSFIETLAAIIVIIFILQILSTLHEVTSEKA
jgi:hypothetical protein